MTGLGESRAAVVTGAAGDLGGAVAESLAADGWRVYAADLREAPAGGGRVPVVLDVRDRGAVFALARRAEEEAGLGIWVNAAGIFEAARVAEADPAVWDLLIAVNLTGSFHGCAAALAVMAPTGRGGRIVNVGSLSGQIGGIGVHPAYGASKAGVHALTKSYALEGAKSGVLCNAVAPGVLEGRMTAKFHPKALDKIREGNPLRRLGTMDEVVHAVRFLCDPRAGYTNGTVLQVNGGDLMSG